MEPWRASEEHPLRLFDDLYIEILPANHLENQPRWYIPGIDFNYEEDRRKLEDEHFRQEVEARYKGNRRFTALAAKSARKFRALCNSAEKLKMSSSGSDVSALDSLPQSSSTAEDMPLDQHLNQHETSFKGDVRINMPNEDDDITGLPEFQSRDANSALASCSGRHESADDRILQSLAEERGMPSSGSQFNEQETANDMNSGSEVYDHDNDNPDRTMRPDVIPSETRLLLQRSSAVEINQGGASLKGDVRISMPYEDGNHSVGSPDFSSRATNSGLASSSLGHDSTQDGNVQSVAEARDMPSSGSQFNEPETGNGTNARSEIRDNAYPGGEKSPGLNPSETSSLNVNLVVAGITGSALFGLMAAHPKNCPYRKVFAAFVGIALVGSILAIYFGKKLKLVEYVTKVCLICVLIAICIAVGVTIL